MHKLDRSSVAAPACLALYSYPFQTWDDMAGSHKKEIQKALEQMQGKRCAYCESDLQVHGAQIEHFRRKNPKHYPHLTFVWENLFWACDVLDSCGHFKDKPGNHYKPEDLLKPDEDDPDDFLYFHSDGDVRVRPHIEGKAKHRAEETMRVFNLKRSELVGLRRKAVERYQKKEPDMLTALMTWPEEDRRAYLESEVAATQDDPYATTIRHFLERHR